MSSETVFDLSKVTSEVENVSSSSQEVSGSKITEEAKGPKSFVRRDHLREIEKRIQEEWERENVFCSNPDENKPKFFVTFPYPYMNGRLHLGHAFSLTKAEFTARFQALKGKNVLFPFAFHCTGMPIQAAANKLRDEINSFGCPPVFPVEEEASEESKEESKNAESIIAAKSKGKKTKLVVKGQAGTKKVRQWDILAKMVPSDEIHEFADPLKWLNYFPPYGATDLKAFGSAIDWRRSYITTAVNPYYDAFIRWQFNRLREGNRIKFGKRPTIYSPLDKQVCADHDRSSGEGVEPQEYTLIKLEILDTPENSPLRCAGLEGKKVFLAPATLRPETMYGQTNCFVLPEGDYGAFEISTGEVLIMSARAARGLAHQGWMKEWGVAESLVDLKGWDLLGLPLKAPNAKFDRVYTLPLVTISMNKGTGVVTSVPSDAPDDYVALKELKDKPLWREKFGITAEMVEPFDVVPIVEIEGYGDKSAVFMCEKLDIKSCKDTEKLKLAKDEVYLKGFYQGVMLVGECVGMKVCDAKPIIRNNMLELGQAIPYFEPEGTVVSRTGDECVVALVDQWYLAYGDPEWRDSVLGHIKSDNFTGYTDKIMEKFDQVLNWLKEWACSRSFGLGTQLPWDEKWVIDSLSDSTIYMAYYTIAHFFHGDVDNMSGLKTVEKIKPEDLNDDVFNYIFLGKPFPEGVSTNIDINLLDSMRREFEYWYPMDLRVSAKDLIPNHLTMCLYNHAEIWKDRPEMWPRGIYCNGHIMVDAEKMAKSKGNFLMMLESVEEYSADATRFALADAGDTMEDANFDRSVANQAIIYLFNEEEWIKSIVADISEGKLRTGEQNFMDRTFSNEIDFLVESTSVEFEKMFYREGIHRSWFDMTIARDMYRDWSVRCNLPMHQDVVFKYIQTLIVINSPICPHWCDHIWRMLGNSGSVCNASWPSMTGCDKNLRKEYNFFKDFLKNIRQACIKSKVASPKGVYVYVAHSFDEKKKAMLAFLRGMFDESTNTFSDTLMKGMKEFCESDPAYKKETKILMQFGAFMRDEALERGADALASELHFDQKAILEVCLLVLNLVSHFISLNLLPFPYL